MLHPGQGEASTPQSAFVSMNEGVALFLQCLHEIKYSKRMILLDCLTFPSKGNTGPLLREAYFCYHYFHLLDIFWVCTLQCV